MVSYCFMGKKNIDKNHVDKLADHRKRGFSIVSEDQHTNGVYRKHGMAGALGIVAAMAFIMYGLFAFNVFIIDYEMGGVTGLAGGIMGGCEGDGPDNSCSGSETTSSCPEDCCQQYSVDCDTCLGNSGCGWMAEGDGSCIMNPPEDNPPGMLTSCSGSCVKRSGCSGDCGLFSTDGVACYSDFMCNEACIVDPICGDLECNGGETCSSCPGDCGACAAVCSDGIINGDDQCDGTNITETCGSMGFYTGTISCVDCVIVTTGCTNCGNNTIDSGETCDGTALGGETCKTKDYDMGGTLACSASCDAFDFSGCEASSICDDGNITSPEVCEAGKLNGQTCELQGKGPGILTCGIDCKSFDTSECTEVTETETPDDTSNNDTPDTNTDSNDSSDNETSSDACGNWVIDTGEDCDLTNLNGQTCEKKDYASGLLKCKSTCKFDYSECVNEEVTEDDASEIIQEASNQIEAAKAQERDTKDAEALLIEALDAYNSDDPDYELAKEKANAAIDSIGDLITSSGDGPVGMVQLGVIVIVLIVILVAVVMIKKRAKTPAQEKGQNEQEQIDQPNQTEQPSQDQPNQDQPQNQTDQPSQEQTEQPAEDVSQPENQEPIDDSDDEYEGPVE